MTVSGQTSPVVATDEFTFVPPPTVGGVSPNSGPNAGGTAVTINGTGFGTASGATAVRFGPYTATNISCSSATQCVATSPPGSGTVDVRVTVGGQISPTAAADHFSYPVLALGDVNGDGHVTSVDALCVLRQVVGLPSTTNCPIPSPGNPIVATTTPAETAPTSIDALCILRGVVGLPSTANCPTITASAAQSGSAAPVAGAAQRSGPADVEISVSPQSGRLTPGHDTTVQIQAKAAGLGAWTVDVGYDPKTVRITDCKAAEGSVCNPSFADGVVRVAGASPSGLQGQQTLATRTVEAIGDAGSSSPFRIIAETMTDTSGRELSASVTTGASPAVLEPVASPDPTRGGGRP